MQIIPNPKITRKLIEQNSYHSWFELVFNGHFRLVTAIGDTYGFSLLLHMLTTTINLTLLAYQATKVNAFNVYAFSTIGYLLYSFAQVFHFCVFGNRLIEEVIFTKFVNNTVHHPNIVCNRVPRLWKQLTPVNGIMALRRPKRLYRLSVSNVRKPY